ncbi:nickel pincer cofactor biosynthesis protein LarC [Nocardioides koreensis]|uniref:Pyridinium-3,5-bisthiocarboxylic acid mononucleotide nickel insertion protein n=1 Tax=Nocardioides koreensis TaxID=433651 RepID=A0ABP5L1V4_9ACTN
MTVWIDASSGASGDMLLGALVGAGVPVEVLQAAVDAIAPEPVALRVEQVTRNGFAATRCHVEIADSVEHRTWRDVRALLTAADLDPTVRDLAVRTFERLAVAEGAVHGHDPDEVHFHEVGALDAIADVVGACAGFAWLWSRQARSTERSVVVSPVAVGAGSVRGAHGTLPVPPPAVAELLRGVPSYAGPPGAPAMELCTPTGAALLTTLATGWGPQPAMTTDAIGVGAGGRDPEGHANVLRLLVSTGSTTGDSPTGDSPTTGTGPTGAPLLVETNIDDLDPRVWPAVIAALLEAGASDAWLTPILMKKGRPAHTLSVLVAADRAAAVRAEIFRQTSTIGLREQPLGKHALDREMVSVDVDGQPVAVKLARHDGVLVNAQPEYDDVARAAAALGRPVLDVLNDAVAASRTFLRQEP